MSKWKLLMFLLFLSHVFKQLIPVMIGLAIHKMGAITAVSIKGEMMKTVVETSMELVGLIIIVYGLLRMFIVFIAAFHFLAESEPEELRLRWD